MAQRYFDEWSSHEDLPYGDDNPTDAEVVYASYTFEGYEGSAIIVFRRDGKWFENNDSHCSCHGLEDWRPEETSLEALRIRRGWDGLQAAIDAVVKGR